MQPTTQPITQPKNATCFASYHTTYHASYHATTHLTSHFFKWQFQKKGFVSGCLKSAEKVLILEIEEDMSLMSLHFEISISMFTLSFV
jgi:hypothetical protein